MRANIARYIVSWAPLPRDVQQMIISSMPTLRPYLATAESLDDDLRIELINQGDPDVVRKVLDEGRMDPDVADAVCANMNLPARLRQQAAGWYAGTVPHLPQSWVDLQLAAGNTGPRAGSAILKRDDVAPGTKAAVLPHANYDDGLRWLMTDHGRACTDEQAWAVLCDPSGAYAVDTAIWIGGLVIGQRPGLIGRAFNELWTPHAGYSSSDTRECLLLSLSAIPLSGDHQVRLIHTANQNWIELETMQRAVHNLLYAPWCSPEALDLVNELDLDAAARLRDRGYPWSRLKGTPVAEIEGFWVRRWLFRHANLWMGLDCEPFVLDELHDNPHLSAGQRRYVDTELKRFQDRKLRAGSYERSPHGPAYRTGVRQPVWPLEKSMEARDKTIPEAAATEICWYLHHTLGANATVWAVALTLLGDGFDGSLADLAEVSHLLGQ